MTASVTWQLQSQPHLRQYPDSAVNCNGQVSNDIHITRLRQRPVLGLGYRDIKVPFFTNRPYEISSDVTRGH